MIWFFSPKGADLKGVTAYNRVDIVGLYTLGTVVVDYRGYRVIAQSIIPGNELPNEWIPACLQGRKKCSTFPLAILGILQRDQENSVVYGSIDAGKTVTSNPEFLKLVRMGPRPLFFIVCQFLHHC